MSVVINVALRRAVKLASAWHSVGHPRDIGLVRCRQG
jgi:hypothetical protein